MDIRGGGERGRGRRLVCTRAQGGAGSQHIVSHTFALLYVFVHYVAYDTNRVAHVYGWFKKYILDDTSVTPQIV